MTNITVTKKWGEYTDLYTTSNNKSKVKELVILPGEGISMQKHFMRSEIWFIVEGEATVYTKDQNNETYKVGVYGAQKSFNFAKEEWHKVTNEGQNLLKIIEIQYGAYCAEDDILRQE
jgi:mannose-1-phosphate guanylyltransferase